MAEAKEEGLIGPGKGPGAVRRAGTPAMAMAMESGAAGGGGGAEEQARRRGQGAGGGGGGAVAPASASWLDQGAYDWGYCKKTRLPKVSECGRRVKV